MSASNAGDVVCDQWLRHHEVQDPRAMWSSPGGEGEGECPGSSLWSSDTKFKIIKSHKVFKALKNTFPQTTNIYAPLQLKQQSAVERSLGDDDNFLHLPKEQYKIKSQTILLQSGISGIFF